MMNAVFLAPSRATDHEQPHQQKTSLFTTMRLTPDQPLLNVPQIVISNAQSRRAYGVL